MGSAPWQRLGAADDDDAHTRAVDAVVAGAVAAARAAPSSIWGGSAPEPAPELEVQQAHVLAGRFAADLARLEACTTTSSSSMPWSQPVCCKRRPRRRSPKQLFAAAVAPPCTADDVSRQKAAAQARFAQQQELCQSASAAEVQQLQQEAARLRHAGAGSALAYGMLCNLVCCFVVLAAKGSVPRLSAALLRGWPLVLPCGLACLLIHVMQPLQFRDARLEQQYAARHHCTRTPVDAVFLAACCTSLAAALTGTSSSGGSAAAQRGVLLLLLLAASAALALLAAAPQRYQAWREGALFVGRVGAVCTHLLAQQTGGSDIFGSSSGTGLDSPTLHAPQQQHAGPATMLLPLAAVHGGFTLALLTRLSAFLPLQLLHVAAVLASLASSSGGGGGGSITRQALQLLAFGLWLPAALLYAWEAGARRSFLAERTRRLSKCCVTGDSCSSSRKRSSSDDACSANALRMCSC